MLALFCFDQLHAAFYGLIEKPIWRVIRIRRNTFGILQGRNDTMDQDDRRPPPPLKVYYIKRSNTK